MLATIDVRSRPRSARSLMRALSLIGLGAVLYATLYPWSDWRLRQPGALAFMDAGLPRYWTWFDVTSNVVAYLLLTLVATLGWLERMPRRWAVPLATLALSALSFGLEAMQSWLPARVPSLLDWLANSAGALLGALLGAALARGDPPRDRQAVVPVRERWHEQGSPIGCVLLLVWLSTQLVPQRLLFATGWIRPALESLADTLLIDDEFERLAALLSLPAAHGVLIEATAVICAIGVIGILVLDLVRSPPQRVLLLAVAAFVALLLKSIATQRIYGTGSPFAWLTPGAQGGLVVGVLLLYGLATLGPRSRASCAVALLGASIVLVNIAPPDRYFETMATGVAQGQLLNLNALLRFASAVWPFAAIPYFWVRIRRRSRRSA